jgi:hypothetical protein
MHASPPLQSWGAIAGKSTDVPGLSRSNIPIMASRGRKSVHIGYNGACLPADVPQVREEEDGVCGSYAGPAPLAVRQGGAFAGICMGPLRIRNQPLDLRQ